MSAWVQDLVPKSNESESGQMVPEKVKWAYYDVYLSQTMWNQTKKSLKQLKRPNSLISHWFPVEMVHNGPKLCKRKRFFLCCKNLTSCWFRQCDGFCCYDFLDRSYCCSKSSQISGFFLAKWRRNKNKYAFNFEFHTSIFNQGGANRYVFRLIEWQNLKGKIVTAWTK